MKGKIYTGLGDGGETGVLGSGRYPKSHRLFEALGSIEELSASLGVVKSITNITSEKELLTGIQRSLYRLMAQLSVWNNKQNLEYFPQSELLCLDKMIEEISTEIDIPEGFILPGDTVISAQLDLARAISRRAERRVVELCAEKAAKQAHILAYVNRLSTLLFLLEIREINRSHTQVITMAK